MHAEPRKPYVVHLDVKHLMGYHKLNLQHSSPSCKTGDNGTAHGTKEDRLNAQNPEKRQMGCTLLPLKYPQQQSNIAVPASRCGLIINIYGREP